MKVTIQEVVTKKDLKAFVHYPNELYKDNKYYVPTLESGDRDTLDPKKNHAFEFCEGKYWLARDEKGAIVGRIAGIINHQYNKKTGTDFARFGFMDFIDDNAVVENAAHLLCRRLHDRLLPHRDLSVAADRRLAVAPNRQNRSTL